MYVRVARRARGLSHANARICTCKWRHLRPARIAAHRVAAAPLKKAPQAHPSIKEVVRAAPRR